MAVCRIKTRFDHLETANMTGIKNDVSVMDGTDLNTGAGGRLRHGRRRRRRRRRGRKKKVERITAEVIYVLKALRSQESY